MENRDKETFSYTYSAKEQTEIQNIRKKYETTTEQEDKMAQLRRLDASVSSKATTVALVVGIVGALIIWNTATRSQIQPDGECGAFSVLRLLPDLI